MIANRRPDAVGADQRQRQLLLAHGPAALNHRQPLGMGGKVLELAAEPQFDVGIVVDLGGQRRLQVGAMHHPIGRAGAGRGCFAERQAGDFAAQAGAHDADGVGDHGAGGEARFEAEIDQHAAGIGRQLQAGAGLFKPLGLLENDDAKSLRSQRQRRRQSPDPGSGDEDRA